MRVLLVIFLFFANFPRVVISDFILDSDLSKALASLYKLNPKNLHTFIYLCIVLVYEKDFGVFFE